MPRPRSWTDEQLIAAVAASKNLKEVHTRLGITPGKYDVLRAHIRRLGIDASHLPRAGSGSPRSSRRFRDEDLIEAVKLEWTVHGVLRRLGYSTSGATWSPTSGGSTSTPRTSWARAGPGAFGVRPRG